jgi:hypothetical protein
LRQSRLRATTRSRSPPRSCSIPPKRCRAPSRNTRR